MEKKLFLVLLTVSMVNQSFGFFGDVGGRAAERIATRRAAARAAEQRAEERAVMQDDWELIQGLITLAGIAVSGAAYFVGSTVYTGAHYIIEPSKTWDYLWQGDTCTVVGTVGCLAAIGTTAFLVGREKGRRADRYARG